MARQTHWKLPAAVAVLAGLLVAAYAGWRWRAARALLSLADAVPEAPFLADHRAELQARIMDAMRRVEEGPDRLQALAGLSRLYHANGFSAEAARCYLALARVEPENARWPYFLSLILADYGQLEEALPWAQRTVALAPNQIPARVHLGNVLLKLDRTDEAAKAYGEILVRGTPEPFALLGLARCDIQAERWSEARNRLRRILRDHPHFDPAWKLLASVHARLGEARQAAAARNAVSGAAPEIADPWREELMGDCLDPYQLAVAAAAAEAAGDNRRAAALLSQAAAIDPGDEKILVQWGKVLARLGEAAGAQRCFERSIELAPTHDDAWAALTILLAAQGKQAAAERTLAEGLMLCPDSAGLHLGNGRRLAQAGHLEAAAAEFRETIRLRPREADAYLDLAQTCLRLGREADAAAVLRQALTVQPAHPGALTALARQAITTGDAERARELLEEIRQHPRVPPEEIEAIVRAFDERFTPAP